MYRLAHRYRGLGGERPCDLYQRSNCLVDRDRQTKERGENIRMFIIVQIPFVDLRLISDIDYTNYTDDNTKGCFFPNIFTNNLEKSKYYRFLGESKNRYNANELPISERSFFCSRKIIQLGAYKFNGDGLYIPKLLFSRFFTDTHSFHFDIGIREALKNNISRQDFNRFVKEFLASPLFCINKKFQPVGTFYDLPGLAEEIKQVYLYDTTSKRKVPKENYLHQVVLGHPAVFIIYDKMEVHTFGNAREINLQNGIKVRYDLIPVKNTVVDVWYIGKDGLPKHNQDLRNLRIYLSKLNSYKESTRIVLEHLEKNGNRNIDVHKVSTFLNHMLIQMSRDKYYGYDNNNFWETVFYISNQYDHETWNNFTFRIRAKLKEIEMTASKNNYVQQNIYGGHFENSTIIGQNVNEETRGDLEKRIQEFEQMALALIRENSQLTDEQQNFLKSQMENFEEHIKSEKPQHDKALKLLNNIKVAFQFVIINSEGIQRLMEMGKTIVETFK